MEEHDSGKLYHSYLLRMRCSANNGQPVWRFELQTPTGWSRTFFSLMELVQFLDELTGDQQLSQTKNSV